MSSRVNEGNKTSGTHQLEASQTRGSIVAATNVDKNTTMKDQEETTKEADKECINFMSKFRDKDTRALKNLNSAQFIEVWNNYDKDGKSK